MTDTTLNRFLASGTAAQRAAFTPAPPTPASGPSPTYFWLETDTGDCYAWNASGAAWVQIVSGSGASIAWGAITGTLSSQTDLQAALDAKLPSASYTAADVLAKLLTVDGAGSGLDADTLDGLSSAAFAAASHTHPQSDITDLTTDLAAKLAAANNLSDLADAAIARTNLGLAIGADVQAYNATLHAQEWAPNFTAAGDLYIPADVAMTISQGNATIGTGTLTYTKSTAAAPSTFGAATLPVTLEAGAWLKVSASSVTGFVATHLVRTA